MRPGGDALPRDRLIRGGTGWVLTGLVHLLFLLALTFSLHQNALHAGRRMEAELILDLSLLHGQNAPPVNLIKPDVVDQTAPEINIAPITIPPPKPNIIQPHAPATPGDVLNALGQALACGANNFEYLNQAQRERCRRIPWHGLRLPNGAIVLEAPPRLNLTPPPVTGAEALRRRMQTAPPCPMILNTPCMQTTPLLTLPTN
jgi:hypothetical protein